MPLVTLRPAKPTDRVEDPVVSGPKPTPDKVGHYEANTLSQKSCYKAIPNSQADVTGALSLLHVAHSSKTAVALDSRELSNTAAVSEISQTVELASVSQAVVTSPSSSSEDTFVSVSSPTNQPAPSPASSSSAHTSTSDFSGFPDIESAPPTTPEKSLPPNISKGPNRKEVIKKKKQKIKDVLDALAKQVIRGQPSTSKNNPPPASTPSTSQPTAPIPPPLPAKAKKPHIGRVTDSCPLCTDSSVLARLSPEELKKLRHYANCSNNKPFPELRQPQEPPSRPNTRQQGVPKGKCSTSL
jgi:hypothetical protein